MNDKRPFKTRVCLIRRASVALIVLLLLVQGCGDSKKSDKLSPEDIVTVKGKYIAIDGSPLASKNVTFRNLRIFSFIDYTSPTSLSEAIAMGIGEVATVIANIMLIPYYAATGQTPAPIGPQPQKNKAGYYLDSFTTNDQGEFSLKVRVGNLLRDRSGVINADLVNDASSNLAFGKFAFKIKDTTVELGEVQLCDLGGVVVTEVGDQVKVAWTLPAREIKKMFVNFGLQSDNSLIWSAEPSPQDGNLTVPKAVFGSQPFRVVIEAFYRFDDQLKISCYSPPKDMTLQNPVESLAKNRLATTPSIEFKISTLTNGRFNDKMVFEPFSVTNLFMDLGNTVQVRSATLHNLSLKSSGLVTVAVSTDNNVWTQVATGDAKRFQFLTFADPSNPANPIMARYVRIQSSTQILDLKEVMIE